MKKKLLFLFLLIAGFSANAQLTPINQLNYVKLLKIPPVGVVQDSALVYNGTDGFVKMRPLSSLITKATVTKSGIVKTDITQADPIVYTKTTSDNLLKLKDYLSTGLLKNGLITINADPTKFNVSAGIGVISNFDDPENPLVEIINFPAFTGVTPTYLLTGNITYIAVTKTPSIQLVMQATPFTNTQLCDLISLGAVVHSNLTTINVVNPIAAPSNSLGTQLHSFMVDVGSLNLVGNKYTANGANLSLDKSAGTIFKFGVNFANDWKDPHHLNQSLQTLLTFRYRFSNSVEGADRTTLDPSFYEVAGVSTPVPPGRFSIQTVTMFQTGLTRIQPGQNTYATLLEAKQAISTRAFAIESNIAANGIRRAYIILAHNATSLQNTSTSEILEEAKYGGAISGGVALTLANIVTALGYTPENVANKATDFTTLNNTLYPTTQAVSNGFIKNLQSFPSPQSGNISLSGINYTGDGSIDFSTYNTAGSTVSTHAKSIVAFTTDPVDTINNHSFSDNSNFYSNINGVAHNSFDYRIRITGSGNIDHVSGFQDGAKYFSTGTIANMYGFNSSPTINSGIVTNRNGVNISDVLLIGGSVTDNIGILIKNLVNGSNNLAIRTLGVTKSEFGGDLNLRESTSTIGSGTNVRFTTGTSTPIALIKPVYNSTISGSVKVMVKNSAGTTDANTTEIVEFKGGVTPELIVSGNATATGFIKTGAPANNILKADATNSLIYDNQTVVGIGTTNTTGKFNIFTGLAGVTVNPVTQDLGTINFSNQSSSKITPTISGKSDTSSGIIINAYSVDSNVDSDILLGVRENDNTDFSVLTNSALQVRRFGTNLLDILRNGNSTFLGTVSAATPTTGSHLTTKTYVDAKVTQTIANGVTTTAPSEDVVFDALALKISTSSQPLEYIASMTQSGIDAPVVTVVKNTLSGSIVWTRSAVGSYLGTLSGAFTSGKTIAPISSNAMGTVYFVGASSSTTNTVNVVTKDSTSTGVDDVLNATIHIQVHP